MVTSPENNGECEPVNEYWAGQSWQMDSILFTESKYLLSDPLTVEVPSVLTIIKTIASVGFSYIRNAAALHLRPKSFALRLSDSQTIHSPKHVIGSVKAIAGTC
ncbi:unnamed protein product [Strongylus vulgaris]|uniref:Uncharacterized protein n=1 Tax=Strongylus vulgaris TaxID=40348 RepID=A0A3P7IRB9_STRVU|nr:unnamed protein product [Strongylus vulgaris]